MSMIGWLVAATDDEIRQLHRTPEKVRDFLSERQTSKGPSSLCLDKAWHGLHWLLTGTAYEGEEPLNFIVLGGTELGHEYVGYGPAHAFTSEQVRRIGEALEPIATADLLARFDGRAIYDVYPEVWDRPDERDGHLQCLRQCLRRYFEALKRFVARTTEFGLGVIVVVD